MWQAFKNLYHLGQSIMANIYFGFPAKKLTVIGVTGTDGKTTTVSLIYHLLKTAKKSASMISSVEAIFGNEKLDTGFHVTTPGPVDIPKYLQKAVDNASEYLVLEVTSHALDQNRVWGIDFVIGVITNVTHEHLDYHRRFESYLKTKIKLLKQSGIAVVNRDDQNLYQCIDILIQNGLNKKPIISFGLKKNADYNPKNFPFKTSLKGEFNQYNILAAAAVGDLLGIKRAVINKAIKSYQGVKGRLETVYNKEFRVIIDFAHTPNAIENALLTARRMTVGRLIHVFGSAGLRDKKKRPLMGQASAKYAEVIVLTAEDPRVEDPNDIAEQIANGFRSGQWAMGNGQWGKRGKRWYFKILDRQEAINFAIKIARKGDLIIITGKGHERSMCFGKKEYPWSEQEAVRKAINIKNEKLKIKNTNLKM